MAKRRASPSRDLSTSLFFLATAECRESRVGSGSTLRFGARINYRGLMSRVDRLIIDYIDQAKFKEGHFRAFHEMAKSIARSIAIIDDVDAVDQIFHFGRAGSRHEQGIKIQSGTRPATISSRISGSASSLGDGKISWEFAARDRSCHGSRFIRVGLASEI